MYAAPSRRAWRVSLALAALAGAVVMSFLLSPPPDLNAGYLESDFPQERSPQPTPPPQPRPEPPPRPEPLVDNPTTRLIGEIRVGGPIRWGQLVLFPVTLPGAEPATKVYSLGTAVDRGWVTIAESKPATVSKAVLANSSDHHVLVLAGELIEGGRQHRSAQDDLLLGPHSTVTIDLFCVERGRWAGEAKFKARKQLAPQSVRSANVAGADQAEVWSSVGKFNSAAGANSRSDSLLAGLDSDKVKRELSACRRIVLPRLPRNCIGLVAGRGGWRGGHVFAADLFVDEDLFAAYRQMLIDSYAGEEVYYQLQVKAHPPARDERGPGRPAIRPVPPPTEEQARQFVRRVLRSRFDARTTRGRGELWRIFGGGVSGQSLDLGGQSVHVALTRPMVRPMPPPIPMPGPMPRPRRENN